MERVRFDAIEAWNSKTIERGSNPPPLSTRRGSSLLGIAGSDSHFAGTVGRAHTLVEAGELSVGAVLLARSAPERPSWPGRDTGAEMVRYQRGGSPGRGCSTSVCGAWGRRGATLRRAQDRPVRARGPAYRGVRRHRRRSFTLRGV